MTLKERWQEMRKSQQAVHDVKEAKLKKEHAAREAVLNKKAKELSEELGVSKETAKKYVKAQKVSELRATRRKALKEKAVKTGRAIQKSVEEAQKAQVKSTKKKGKQQQPLAVNSDFFGDTIFSAPTKPKKTKTKTKVKSTKKKGGAKKRKPKGTGREIRIIIE